MTLAAWPSGVSEGTMDPNDSAMANFSALPQLELRANRELVEDQLGAQEAHFHNAG